MSSWKVSELTVKYSKHQMRKSPVETPRDLHDLCLSVWDMDTIDLQESFYLFSFDTQHHWVGYKNLFTGGANSITITTRLIFQVAAQHGAHKIAVAHNHPGGDLRPSKEDISMTIKLLDGCYTMGIEMFDHLIISPTEYYSFSDEEFFQRQRFIR